eukprot:10437718-Alexandrium_andersonii.AAC.1
MALAGFSKAIPDRQRDPLPWPAAVAIALELATHFGSAGVAEGRAVVVSFDGYLRPSEALA